MFVVGARVFLERGQPGVNDDWSDLYEVATAAGGATLLRERVRDVDENWPDSMLPFEGRLYFHTNEFDEIVEHDMTSGSQRNIVSGGGVRLGSVHGGYVYYCRNLTTYERAPLQVDVPTVLVEGVGVGESIACHVGAHGQYFYYVRGNRVLRQRTPD